MKTLINQIAKTQYEGRDTFCKVEKGILMVTDAKRAVKFSAELFADGMYNDRLKTVKPEMTGVFPSFERIFPKTESKLTTQISVKDLEQAVKFCLVLGKKERGHVFFEFRPEGLSLVSLGYDGLIENGESVEMMVDCVPTSLEMLVTCLDGTFVLEFLAYCKRQEQEFFALEFFAENYPVLLSVPDCQCLLAPLGVYRKK